MSDRWQYAKPEPTPGKVCKDCLAELGEDARTYPRRAPYPGPRCATHHRAEQRRRRLAAAGRRVESTYGLTPEQYDELLAFQSGVCAVCGRAKGTTKRLAVDHDHRQAMADGHDPKKGCPNCVRGLVCGPCNDVLGHFRDDLASARRLVAYMERAPWKRMDDSVPRGRWAEGISGSRV